jgi:hypothetical protein
MIKAIETEYAGCRFRSRLEARWAVFFDALGVQWEHEPEGFETSAGRYLPDFRISAMAPFWFEVKPDGFGQDARHLAFARELRQGLVVARGMSRSYDAQFTGDYLTMLGDHGESLKIDFAFDPRHGGLTYYLERQPWNGRIDRAYAAARSARFGT